MKKDLYLWVRRGYWKTPDNLIFKVENWKKQAVKVEKQKTARLHNARAYNYIDNSRALELKTLKKIRFFKEKKVEIVKGLWKIRAYNEKKRVENFLINNISRETLKNNKEIAKKRAIAILSKKL